MVERARERLTDAAAHWWFYVYAVVGFVAAVGYGYAVGWSVGVGLETLILLSLAATLVYSGDAFAAMQNRETVGKLVVTP